MFKLNLIAKSEEEERILEYLENNCSKELAETINENEERPLLPCWNYIVNEIMNEYVKEKGRVNGGCGKSADYVFGLAVHYYEDVETKEDMEKASKLFDMIDDFETTEKEESKYDDIFDILEPVKKNKKNGKYKADDLVKAYNQISIFDLI